LSDQDAHKRSFETFDAVVEESRVLTPRNKNIRFRVPADKPFYYKAGQFVQIFVPTPEKVRRTSYSIASAPTHHEYFELCVIHVDGGVSSTFLHNLKVGEKVQAMGPLGRFTMFDPLKNDPVFICTGSGIAPFRSMIGDLFAKNTTRNVYLIFGNRFDGDIIYQDEWEKLQKEKKNFKALFTLSRADEKWKGARGYVQEQIAGFIPNPPAHDFFICGLSKMINDVESKLLSLGVPKEQIHFERYD
jgi:ferredoxin-NADP reductase